MTHCEYIYIYICWTHLPLPRSCVCIYIYFFFNYTYIIVLYPAKACFTKVDRPFVGIFFFFLPSMSAPLSWKHSNKLSLQTHTSKTTETLGTLAKQGKSDLESGQCGVFQALHSLMPRPAQEILNQLLTGQYPNNLALHRDIASLGCRRRRQWSGAGSLLCVPTPA